MSAQHRRSPQRRPWRPRGAAASRHPRGERLVVVVCAVAAVAGWLMSAGLGPPAAGGLALLSAASTEAGTVVDGVHAPPASSPPRDRAEDRWYTVLAQLDAVRERAWRQGSTALLARVYAEGSPELKADRRHLRAYLARGLRVEGVSLTVRRLTVVEVRHDRVRLRVVEQLGPVEATTVDGRARSLPTDRPTCHLIDLRREGGWRIARIVAVASARG